MIPLKLSINNEVAMHILDKTAPGLIEQLRAVPFSQGRSVLAKACQLAGKSIRDLEPEVQVVLDGLFTGNGFSEKHVVQLRSYIKWSDERYFTLRERGVDAPVWQNWFDKARLASALVFGFSNDSIKALADALYELSVTGNGVSILDFIRCEIEKVNSK